MRGVVNTSVVSYEGCSSSHDTVCAPMHYAHAYNTNLSSNHINFVVKNDQGRNSC